MTALALDKTDCFADELVHQHELSEMDCTPCPQHPNPPYFYAGAKTGKLGALGSLGEDRTTQSTPMPVLTLSLCLVLTS